MLILATGLYGESDEQPRLDATLFWAFPLGDGVHHGFGGAVGYSFIPSLELEGEVYIIFDPSLYGVSGTLLCNIVISDNKSFPYILGVVSTLGAIAGRGGADTFFTLGGGMKVHIKKNNKIRFDFRYYLPPNGDGWIRLACGLMWTF